VEWPEPVERGASYLREAGAEARLEEFSTGTPTAEDAARAVGSKLSEIVKSLVFDCDGQPVLAMVPGDRRADPTKIREAAGCRRARVATADEVRRATGFEPGAVAPFPLPAIERVFMDPTLLAHEIVWIGAGSTRHMVSIRPAELARLAKARQVDIAAAIN
jgi:prolyl-tRNA editing enzyme YbaK/EbsC (Cys-tRNA(Pro) deacylase)